MMSKNINIFLFLLFEIIIGFFLDNTVAWIEVSQGIGCGPEPMLTDSHSLHRAAARPCCKKKKKKQKLQHIYKYKLK